MKKEKCILFDFTKGTRVPAAYYHYKNGQLDLDLRIEVRSPEPAYGSNVLKFKKAVKDRKNGPSREEMEEPFNIA